MKPKTPKELDKIWEKFQLKFKPYIFEKNIALLYEYVHFRKDYLVENPDKEYDHFVTGSTDVTDFDKTDLKLLGLIAADARIPIIELARKLRLTSTAISYRIKQLEKKKIILGYRAMISLAKTGYEYYKIDLIINDMSIKPQLFQFAKQHPNCIYVDRTIGGTDFECDFELRNQREFMNLMAEIKNKFKGQIRTYKYYVATVIYKISYLPHL